MDILHVVGARPNFMKVAPVMDALENCTGINQALLHTGQHYDANMSQVFFQQLALPKPAVNLEVGSASHAVQTAEIMVRFEQVITRDPPNLVLVYGDVNSTVSTALVCAKLLIPVGHVEAGLRSFDRTMPEEINRLMTDQLADLLFTPSEDGDANLLREGIDPKKIHCVGNVMIDTLKRLLPLAEPRWAHLRQEYKVDRFGLVTIHRPSNVDDPAVLSELLRTLEEISEEIPIIFPLHPRTRKQLTGMNVAASTKHLHVVAPLSYLDFLATQAHATLVITDSGGVQEETTFLGVPCMTVRDNTERPVTITTGTNVLVGHDMEKLKHEVRRALNAPPERTTVPPYWDGKTGERIAAIIQHLYLPSMPIR